MNQHFTTRREDGFTLIELIVVVSLITVMSAVGVSSYTASIDNNRQDAVELAAQTVLTEAKSQIADYDERTKPEHAAAMWFNKYGRNQAEVYVVDEPLIFGKFHHPNSA